MLNNRREYRHIFIVDSLANWDDNSTLYNEELDLVLTYDFRLKSFIKSIKGDAYYVDHLIQNEEMQKNNFLIYDFFKNWHYSKKGEDIFTYKGIPFGFSLRLEFWNDYITYCRLYLCLSKLEEFSFELLFIDKNNTSISELISELGISFKEYIPFESKNKKEDISYFPISKWLDEKLRPSRFRSFLRESKVFISSIYSYLMIFMDKLFFNKKTVFVQEYHPTREILNELRSDKNISLLLEGFSLGSTLNDKLKERILPIFGSIKSFEKISDEYIQKLNSEKHASLVLGSKDVSSNVFTIITKRISKRLPYILRTLEGCIKYHNKNKLDLELLIANIGHGSTLFDCVCKNKDIPSFLIINGLLGPEYLDDSKYATYINGYSQSIKENYFKDMNNIYTLGDPRMDNYPPSLSKEINRNKPVVTIGASGFNPVDLNSYVAVEFDFLYDVLKAFEKIIDLGENIILNLKVRPNGYKNQYLSFVNKYFPKLEVNIVDNISMQEVLLETDFYISIYSQTLFEASCLGIPVVYYRKDTEIMNAPFDNKSELVTITNIEDMVDAFYDFKSEHRRYDSFLDRNVMEKYIGPLDGNNLDRNKEFIYSILYNK